MSPGSPDNVVPLYRPPTLEGVLRVAKKYRVFPCRAKDEVVGGTPKTAKSPRIKDWPNAAVQTRAVITDWWHQWPDSLVGVPTGSKAGVVIDIDPTGLQWYEAHKDRLPVTQINRTPRGLHLLFDYPLVDEVRNDTGKKIAPGVDVRGDGGYVIWWPAHGYAIENKGVLSDIPNWLLDLIKEPDPEPEADNALLEPGKTEHTLPQAVDIVNQLDPDMGYDSWRNVGMALHHQFDGHEHAFQLWDQWSSGAKTSGMYPGIAALELKWRSFKKDNKSGAITFRTILGMVNELKVGQPKAINFSILIGKTPPSRIWWHGQWLTNGPTLCSGSGGVGKSLMLQALLTALANGKDYLGPGSDPLRVLGWFCEDDYDEIWRRQIAISNYFGLPLDNAGDRLTIVPRPGFDNTLIDLVHQRPVMVPALTKYLTEQVNDLRIDVLSLDNLGQVFGANEIDRHHVTMFINAIYGMVKGRPFAPLLAGHTARAAGSEFSGSAAWENACRMRWFMGYRVPGQKPPGDEDTEDSDVRWLARRKVNYTSKDVVQLKFEGGLFVPVSGLVAEFDASTQLERAERVVMDGMVKLMKAGIVPSDVKQSGGYIPKCLVDMNWSGGFRKQDLEKAMRRLMGRGILRREAQAGRGTDRHWKSGLVIAEAVPGANA